MLVGSGYGGVEPPNNSHNSLALVQWLHFKFLLPEVHYITHIPIFFNFHSII